jgi:hypothetical protein
MNSSKITTQVTGYIRICLCVFAAIVIVGGEWCFTPSFFRCSYFGIYRVILHVLPGDDGYGNYFTSLFLKCSFYGSALWALGLSLAIAINWGLGRRTLLAAMFIFEGLAVFALLGWFGCSWDFPELRYLSVSPSPYFLIWPIALTAIAVTYGFAFTLPRAGGGGAVEAIDT